jgi:transglutaminase/protease-like cytokinesis protein 3
VSGQKARYNSIDSFAAKVGYYPMDELAKRLTSPYTTDEEKARSIFYWITQHIAYDVKKFHSLRPSETVELDSAEAEAYFLNKSAEEALRKKMGVCEDYASLFKVLCNKAGLTCMVINGMAKNSLPNADSFRENHSWNAIKLHEKWHLVDACWASGDCNSNTTVFKKKFNEHYYNTEPDIFCLDHFPTDSNWLLTEKPVSLAAFLDYPMFVSEINNLTKLQFEQKSGTIEASIGDKLIFDIELDADTSVKDNYRPVTDFDATGKFLKLPAEKPVSTLSQNGHHLHFEYTVWTRMATALYLAYHQQYILAYRLKVK